MYSTVVRYMHYVQRRCTTGLTAERHGIVGNYIWDPATGEEFGLSQVNVPGDNTDNPMWWEDHTPLWISATNAG